MLPSSHQHPNHAAFGIVTQDNKYEASVPPKSNFLVEELSPIPVPEEASETPWTIPHARIETLDERI